MPSSTTATASSTTSPVVTPSPTQPNSIASNCNQFAQAKSGDVCYDFAQKNSITPNELYEWNTVLGDNGSNRGTALQANVWYCVGVTG